jgi:hypothetical protein
MYKEEELMPEDEEEFFRKFFLELIDDLKKVANNKH